MEKGGRRAMVKGAIHQRKLSSLRDAEPLIDMHGTVMSYQVRVPCLHGILHTRSIQRLLQRQIKDMGWVVKGMTHLDALVIMHTMISTSSALMDRMIREAELTPVGNTTATPDPDDADCFSDGEVPSEGRRTTFNTDEEVEGLRDPVVSLAPATHESADRVLRDSELRDPALPLFPTGFNIDKEAPGEERRGAQPLPFFPISITAKDANAEPAPSHTSLRDDDDDKGLSANTPLPAQRGHSTDNNASVALEPGLEPSRQPILLLEYPCPRRLGAYGSATMNLAELMLEAGTGTRSQVLVRAPAIVDMAARAVSGGSPPRILDRCPAYRRLVIELFDSGTALRHHELGSPALQLALQELGSQIEDVATAILTARHPRPVLLEHLAAVKACLHLVWNLRVPATEFQLLWSLNF
ncbi:hypothetical protein CFC21_064615 [Triticum aestivum]|uniref:Uncharacterized protein n=3 Tax=Triticum TaxID=4564 RepID=A0A9R0TJK3_TRITD|nr:hypothetical protein CFC21_064615 [Triticum aestivum]VAI14020.1 unnamed protein product [Triticum turgidum subsp. durum]